MSSSVPREAIVISEAQISFAHRLKGREKIQVPNSLQHFLVWVDRILTSLQTEISLNDVLFSAIKLVIVREWKLKSPLPALSDSQIPYYTTSPTPLPAGVPLAPMCPVPLNYHP